MTYSHVNKRQDSNVSPVFEMSTYPSQPYLESRDLLLTKTSDNQSKKEEPVHSDHALVYSVAGFEQELRQLDLHDKKVLYRGQPDSSWKVNCAAARRLAQDPSTSAFPQLINSYQISYLESLIFRARERMLHHGYYDTYFSDMDLLSHLQHQGAATGLIDFSWNPFVALWFACREDFDVDGAVYAFSELESLQPFDERDRQQPIATLFSGNYWWSWSPDRIASRAHAQESVFVFGKAEFNQKQLVPFVIPASCKRDILNCLELLYDIYEEKLFPDFVGFATANTSNKPLDVRSVYIYRRMLAVQTQDESVWSSIFYDQGVSLSAIGNFNEAITNFDSALKNNPGLTEAYYHRANAKASLNEFENAIRDYDIAINLKPNCPLLYCKRGEAKSNLGLHTEAIQDCDKAIKILPSFSKAYGYRAMSNANRGNYIEAVSDYNIATDLDPKDFIAYLNRGAAKACLNDYENAKTDFDRAIRINPACAEAFMNRGNVNLLLNLREEANSDFHQASKIGFIDIPYAEPLPLP